MYRNYLKRFFDFFAALIGIVVLSPLLIITLLVLISVNRCNPFFFQVRIGKNDRLFRIIKLKTMSDKKDEYGVLLPDEQRMTTVGNFIRRISLDEIPQLLNVIIGDMSLVGPRPLLPEYLPLYSTFQRRRHEVKPGITGWAQVNGRNSVTWPKKFEMDVWYVDHISVSLDFKILFMTVLKVLKPEGVNTEGHVTMTRFLGNDV